jgi:hypothetical protein
MDLTLDLRNTRVFDNVLSKEQFAELFDWYNAIPLVNKAAQGEWNKSWNLGDGNILIGHQLAWALEEPPKLNPPHTILEPVIDAIVKTLRDFKLVEDNANIEFSMTPYCWPAGTGLAWHNDSTYLGAFTYYCHNRWNPEWGGEFITVEGDDYIQEDKSDLKWRVFDNSELHELIMSKGHGHFIHPKPNRLIINKGGKKGILHKVARTTPDSGPRLTLQGFIRQ